MTDKFSKIVRSRVMSRIKSGNTKPEKLVRSIMHSLGYRFRLHDKNLPGKPDIVLKKYQVAVFVNGCFWHQHNNCKYYPVFFIAAERPEIVISIASINIFLLFLFKFDVFNFFIMMACNKFSVSA